MFKYLVGAGLDVAALTRLLAESNLPSDWVATIIDRQGIIVARTRAVDQLLGTPATPTLVAPSRQDESGSFRDVSRDHVPNEANGGRIAAESAPGRGTRFTLSFPVAADHREGPAAPVDSGH